MTPLVRNATTDGDWEQATLLMQQVYVGGGYTAAVNASDLMTRKNLEPAGQLLVAVDDADVVLGAVLLLHPVSDLRQLAGAEEREFRLLAVDDKARGKGVGEQLVQACLDRAFAAGAQAVVLWTQPSMYSAHRLYERMGFRRAPERDHEDPRGFTRLVYVRVR
jgi:ribosomal protein S18 acetylase RimI-like enzyme